MSENEFKSYDSNNYLNKLLNISCHSARMPKIKVQQSPNSVYEMRPTLHICLSFPAGSFKTEKLLAIKEAYKDSQPVEYTNDVTAPSLVGSIDLDNRTIIAPIAYYCKKGSLLVDELDLNPNTKLETLRQMLTFMEYEFTSRKLAIKPTAQYEKEFTMQDAYCKGGWLKFWNLRCNVILGTIKNFRKAHRGGSESYFDALLTRMTPLRFDITKDDLKTMMIDRKLIFQKIDYKIPDEPYISEKDFNYIVSEVDRYGDIVPTQNYVRTINDCLRCFALLQVHDHNLYDFVISNRNWKKIKNDGQKSL